MCFLAWLDVEDVVTERRVVLVDVEGVAGLERLAEDLSVKHPVGSLLCDVFLLNVWDGGEVWRVKFVVWLFLLRVSMSHQESSLLIGHFLREFLVLGVLVSYSYRLKNSITKVTQVVMSSR